MYVYFLRSNGKPKRMKIGKAKDPIARMKTLQTGCPFQIVMAGAIKCKDDAHALRVEKAFHSYFSHMRQQGEWFHCSDEILNRVWEVLDKINQTDDKVRALTAAEMSEMYYGNDSGVFHALASFFQPRSRRYAIRK